MLGVYLFFISSCTQPYHELFGPELKVQTSWLNIFLFGPLSTKFLSVTIFAIIVIGSFGILLLEHPHYHIKSILNTKELLWILLTLEVDGSVWAINNRCLTIFFTTVVSSEILAEFISAFFGFHR